MSSNQLRSEDPMEIDNNLDGNIPGIGALETDQNDEETLLEYYRRRGKEGMDKEESLKYDMKEVERILATNGQSIQDIWGIDPHDCEDESGRKAVWRALLLMTHPDRYQKSGQSPEFLDKAKRACQIIIDTKKAIENLPRKENPGTEDAAKGGPEYLQFYNTVEFIKALIGLMTNPDNAAAINILNSTNSKIKNWNVEKDYYAPRGTVPVSKLQEMYRRAQKVYEQLDEKSNSDKKRPEPNEVQKKELEAVFLESKEFCEERGLPRSFSLPSADYKFNPSWWWLKKHKEQHGNKDGMMSTEEFRAQAEEPTQNNGKEESTGKEKTGQHFANGTSTDARPKFVPHQTAVPLKQTFDGKTMEAAIKIGRNGWLVIVKEEEGAYRLRSGAECGGPNYTKGVVEDLPRLGSGDRELLEREKVLSAGDGRSSFVEMIGLVQHPGATWLLTKWDIEGKIEERWISRSTLSTCLKSRPMVDAMIQNNGGLLLAASARKSQWNTAVAMQQSQKLLLDTEASPAAGSMTGSLPNALAMMQAFGGLSLGRFKHHVFAIGGFVS